MKEGINVSSSCQESFSRPSDSELVVGGFSGELTERDCKIMEVGSGVKAVRLRFSREIQAACESLCRKTWFEVNPVSGTFGDLMKVIREEFRIQGGIQLSDRDGFVIRPGMSLELLSGTVEPFFDVYPIAWAPMKGDLSDDTTEIMNKSLLATSTSTPLTGDENNNSMTLVLFPLRTRGLESMDTHLSDSERVRNGNVADLTQDLILGTSSDSSPGSHGTKSLDGIEFRKDSNDVNVDSFSCTSSSELIWQMRGLRSPSFQKREGRQRVHLGSKRAKLPPPLNTVRSANEEGNVETSEPSSNRLDTPFAHSKTASAAFCRFGTLTPLKEGSWTSVPLGELRYLEPGTVITFKYDLGKQVTAELIGFRVFKGMFLVAKVGGNKQELFAVDKIRDIRKQTCC